MFSRSDLVLWMPAVFLVSSLAVASLAGGIATARASTPQQVPSPTPAPFPSPTPVPSPTPAPSPSPTPPGPIDAGR